jgi:hypothetical protein
MRFNPNGHFCLETRLFRCGRFFSSGRVADFVSFDSQFVRPCVFVFAAAVVPGTTQAEVHAASAPAMLEDAL